MKFTITPTHIYAYGEITTETPDEFLKASKAFSSALPPTIRFWSGGGNIKAAGKLGTMIRYLELNTEVAPIPIKDSMFKDTPAAACYSACTYAFIGGVHRTLSQNAQIGLHQDGYPPGTPRWSYEEEQTFFSHRLGYLRTMGVNAEMLEMALSIPHSSIQVITHTTLREWNFITEQDIPDIDPVLMGNFTPHQ